MKGCSVTTDFADQVIDFILPPSYGTSSIASSE